jgi:hypothetical protein
MKTFRHLAFAATLSVLAAGATSASAVALDDFNRPDSGSLGAGWTQQVGTSGIDNNQAFGDSLSLATFDSGVGNNVSFDLSLAGSGTSYVAAVIGYGSALNYFIKVQSNYGGAFDTFGFYTGNNGGGYFGGLTGGFTSAHVTATVTGSVGMLVIHPNVGADQTYSYDYGTAFSGGATGLGFYGSGRADNFGGDGVPEPAAWALMLMGFAGLGMMLRRRPRLTAAA